MTFWKFLGKLARHIGEGKELGALAPILERPDTAGNSWRHTHTITWLPSNGMSLTEYPVMLVPIPNGRVVAVKEDCFFDWWWWPGEGWWFQHPGTLPPGGEGTFRINAVGEKERT